MQNHGFLLVDKPAGITSHDVVDRIRELTGELLSMCRKYGKGLQPPPTPQIEEDMVRCARCGVHQPKSESILSEGEYYCSQEHRRLNQEKGTD